MPETKGKTLEEMDEVFGSRTATEELEEFMRVQERVGLTALIRGRVEGAGMGTDSSSIGKEGDVDVRHMDKV